MSILSDYNLKWNKSKDGNKTIFSLIFHDSPDPKDTVDDEIIAKIILKENIINVEWYDEGTLSSESNPKIAFSDTDTFETRKLAEKGVKESKKFIGREIINREEY